MKDLNTIVPPAADGQHLPFVEHVFRIAAPDFNALTDPARADFLADLRVRGGLLRGALIAYAEQHEPGYVYATHNTVAYDVHQISNRLMDLMADAFADELQPA